jgi:hypothetical protein
VSRVGQTAELLDVTVSPLRSKGECAKQLLCRCNRKKYETLQESSSPITEPVNPDSLNNLRLYFCVDPCNISGFSRDKSEFDGIVIHMEFLMNKSGTGFSLSKYVLSRQ